MLSDLLRQEEGEDFFFFFAILISKIVSRTFLASTQTDSIFYTNGEMQFIIDKV